jgi:Tfp pilus assembly protein PilN
MSQAAVDFLPEDYVERRAQQRATILFVGLLLVVIAGIAGAYVVPAREANAILAKQAQVRKDYADADQRLRELNRMEAERAKMQEKAEVTALLLEKVKRSVLLRHLTTLMPKGMSWLTLDLKSREIKTELPKTPLEQAKEGAPKPVQKPPAQEVTLTLVGLAQSDEQVADYMTALGKSPLLDEVTLNYSEQFTSGNEKDKDQLTLRRFKVEMRLAPNADGRALEASQGGEGK